MPAEKHIAIVKICFRLILFIIGSIIPSGISITRFPSICFTKKSLSIPLITFIYSQNGTSIARLLPNPQSIRTSHKTINMYTENSNIFIFLNPSSASTVQDLNFYVGYGYDIIKYVWCFSQNYKIRNNVQRCRIYAIFCFQDADSDTEWHYIRTERLFIMRRSYCWFGWTYRSRVRAIVLWPSTQDSVLASKPFSTQFVAKVWRSRW